MQTAVRHLDDLASEPHLEATLVSTTRITDRRAAEVRELVLEIDAPEFLGAVGKNVAVLAPGDPALGQLVHRRLYTIADLPETSEGGRARIKLCVRRCSYVDDYSGEEFPGVASNYLCDLLPGATVALTGPHEAAFEVPADPETTLILIGTGTGIAPFRALVKHLYRDVPDWRGQVMLFYGARSGLELLYMNDQVDDFAQYYDEETFRAFKALSPRPHWNDPIAWDRAISQRATELLELLGKPKTTVYVAGLEAMRPHLDAVFTTLLGSRESWQEHRDQMAAAGRWVELLY